MSRQVEIGGEVYTIQPFSPRKVIIATGMISRGGGTFRQVARELAAFVREYREQNASIVTRSMAVLPPYSENEVIASMTVEAWEKAGGQIEVRRDPTALEQAAVVLPIAFEQAEDEVSRLLALLLIPNGDLASAAKAGTAKEVLSEWADKVLDAGDFGDVLNLVDVALIVLREELSGKEQVVERIKTTVRTMLGMDSPSDRESEDPQGDGSTKRSPSSISSDEPTDGATGTSLTASPPGSPSPSPTA